MFLSKDHTVGAILWGSIRSVSERHCSNVAQCVETLLQVGGRGNSRCMSDHANENRTTCGATKMCCCISWACVNECKERFCSRPRQLRYWQILMDDVIGKQSRAL